MSDECTVKVFAGVCGKTTTVHAKMNEDMNVDITVESDCPMVAKTPVPQVVPWTEISCPMNESVVYKWASENIAHTACPVPCCIIKAVEASSGMALKKNFTIEMS